MATCHLDHTEVTNRCLSGLPATALDTVRSGQNLVRMSTGAESSLTGQTQGCSLIKIPNLTGMTNTGNLHLGKTCILPETALLMRTMGSRGRPRRSKTEINRTRTVTITNCRQSSKRREGSQKKAGRAKDLLTMILDTRARRMTSSRIARPRPRASTRRSAG